MNRKQTEKLIAGLLKQIVAVYRLYDPDAEYLSLTYFHNPGNTEYIAFNNCPHKVKNQIEYHERYSMEG